MFIDMLYNGDISNKSILVHVCCGPCSLGAIEPLLNDGARLTLFYYNPCIIDGEFERRLDALRVVAEHYSLPLIVPAHDYSSFASYAADYASLAEGGERCRLCMDDRISFSARYASANGYDAFTTTLSVSPHKNSKLIFALADAVSDGAPFLARDFKKRDGFLLSCRLAEKLGIYRQKFCGCEYSLSDRNEAKRAAQ